MNEEAYDNRALTQRDRDTIEKKNLRAPETNFLVKRGKRVYGFTTEERMKLWVERNPDQDTTIENKF